MSTVMHNLSTRLNNTECQMEQFSTQFTQFSTQHAGVSDLLQQLVDKVDKLWAIQTTSHLTPPRAE
jgi:hypothetical protein